MTIVVLSLNLLHISSKSSLNLLHILLKSSLNLLHLIPIEVKSGAIGKLRSLHQFMDIAPHKLAVRVWQGPYSVEKAKTIVGTEFTLLNLPFYLVHRIERELDKIQ